MALYSVSLNRTLISAPEASLRVSRNPKALPIRLMKCSTILSRIINGVVCGM